MQTTNPYLYCGNSPAMYVDPDGEFFWAPIIFAAVSAGGMNLAMNAHNVHNVGQGLGYFGIGAAAGAAGALTGGAVAGTLSFGGFAGGLLAGGAGGGVGGFVSGMFSTALNNMTLGTNNNIILGGLKGGLTGAAAGGILGGTVSGIDAVRSGGNFWNGKVLVTGGEVGGYEGPGKFLDEEIPPGAKPTETGQSSRTSNNPNYGKYGWTRRYANGNPKPHFGIDYSGEVGDDVYAMYDGEVIRIGGSREYGEHFVRTSSAINGKTYNVDYGHMSSHSVSLNQSVKGGDLIGLMGRGGNLANTNFPTHVHIAVWRPISSLGKSMGFVKPLWK